MNPSGAGYHAVFSRTCHHCNCKKAELEVDFSPVISNKKKYFKRDSVLPDIPRKREEQELLVKAFEEALE